MKTLAKYSRFAVRTVSQRGLGAAIGGAVADAWFDIRHGLDTALPREINDSSVIGGNASHGVQYQPVSSALFLALMREVPPSLATSVFIDYGCGKGKALILASRLPFKSLIGIEFCSTLHSICEQNIQRFRSRNPSAARIRLILGDAAEVDPPQSPAVHFFYNPFSTPVMTRVIERIQSNRSAAPHCVVLANPITLDLFRKFGYRVRSEHRFQNILEGVILEPAA